MKLFSGFPSGKLQVTPLPNVFFSELVPAIDDLAELKLTLHLIWLLATKKNRVLHVTANELRADVTLVRSLATAGDKPEDALVRALALATERGTLLRLGTDGGDLYFLNSESGRRAFEEMGRNAATQVPVTSAHEPTPALERPNIFVLYEQNIGLLSPMIAEELKEAEGQYPPEWIVNAFRIAVERNKRSWSYVRAILERWREQGISGDDKKGKPWYGDEYGKFVKR